MDINIGNISKERGTFSKKGHLHELQIGTLILFLKIEGWGSTYEDVFMQDYKKDSSINELICINQ